MSTTPKSSPTGSKTEYQLMIEAQQALENKFRLQGLSDDRISELVAAALASKEAPSGGGMPAAAAFSSSASAAAASTSIKTLPPIGIERRGMTCGDIVIGQFLANNPGIMAILASEPILSDLITQIYTGQRTQNTVKGDFGPAMREWIGDNLTGPEKDDWITLGFSDSNTQIDVMDALRMVFVKLSAAGMQYTYKKTLELFDYREDNGETISPPFIPLSIPSEERSFERLLERYFTNFDKATPKKKALKQFYKPPENLVINLERFRMDDYGRKTKISDDITVSEYFKLNPEYTTTKEDAHYRLSGCIIHRGSSLDSGHYILRRVGNNWYLLDDARVQKVSDPRPYFAQGYVFHFEKMEGPIPDNVTYALEKDDDDNSSALYKLLNKVFG